jgi:phosphopantetheine adenylyltransferase
MAKMIKSFKQFSEQAKNPVVFTFGRFNPPTTGHLKLLDKVASIARGKNYRIYASQSEDAKKNPLKYKEKIRIMRRMFPKHGRNIVMNQNAKTALDIATELYKEGFNQLIMVVGSDRVSDFEKLLVRYNGLKSRHGFYDFPDGIKVVSAGERDPDAEGVEGMSASKMRSAAAAGDFKSFQNGLPKGYSDGAELFNLLRKRMGEKEIKNFREHIQLNPVSEKRESYARGEIFNVGDVAFINNKRITIEQRKPNYIVDTAGDKHWLNDLQEALRYDKIYHASSKKISRPSSHPMFFALDIQHSRSDNFTGWYYNFIENDGRAYLYEANVKNKNKVAKYDDRKIQRLFADAGIDLEEVYINFLLANPSGKEIQNDSGTKLLQKNGYVGIQYLDYDPRDFSKDLEALIIFNPSRDTRGFKQIAASNESVEIDEKKNPRIPRKKGQPAGSKKHSDLYTDENPKGTIKGLGFKDVATAKASIKKIENSGRTHAHKIQAAIAMEQRARVMKKTAEAAVYRKYIEKMKKITKKRNEEVKSFKEAYGEWGTNELTDSYKKTTPGQEETIMLKRRVAEKLDPRKHDAGDYVKDFMKSDAPQFKGKSKEEIRKMAVAAYLQARDEAGLKEKSAGLWANIHKRRKSGKKMRKPGEKGAPTKAAFKSASESVAEGKAGKKKKPEPWPKQYPRRVVKTTKPEHKEKGYTWRIKGKERDEISIKLYKKKPSYQEFVKQMKRVAGHEFGG